MDEIKFQDMVIPKSPTIKTIIKKKKINGVSVKKTESVDAVNTFLNGEELKATFHDRNTSRTK